MKKFITLSAILTIAAGFMNYSVAPAHAAAGKCEEIRFSKSNYHVNEADGEVDITIKREVSPLGCPGILNYSTQDDTAVAPYDYTAIPDGEHVFTSEETYTFSVSIVNDVLIEGPEKFKVSFVFNDSAETRATAVVTIADNRQPLPSPSPVPSPVSGSAISTGSTTSATGSTGAKTTRPRSSAGVVTPSPPVEEPAAEAAPAIEESTEPAPTKVRALALARPRASNEGTKKLLAFLTVVLVAAVGVILVAWRQRQHSKQNFSTLAS